LQFCSAVIEIESACDGRGHAHINVLRLLAPSRAGRHSCSTRWSSGAAPSIDGELLDLDGTFPCKVINAGERAKSEFTVQASRFFGADDYAALAIWAARQWAVKRPELNR
jgi:hypothetical protein